MYKQLEIFNLPKIQQLELLTLLNFSGEINNDIIGFKKLAFNKIGYFQSYNSSPHISLGLSKTTSKNLDIEIEKFRKRLRKKEKFEILLKGFDFFENSKNTTIYLRIANPTPLNEIFSMLYPLEKDFNPHITIAKAVPHNIAAILWPLFKNKAYEQKFICDQVRLLKRPYKSNDKWKFVTDIFLL